MQGWSGAARLSVAESPVVERWAWLATASSIEAASSGFGAGVEGTGVRAGVTLVDGRRYIESIVGRKACPKGVERKSVGRSARHYELFELRPM